MSTGSETLEALKPELSHLDETLQEVALHAYDHLVGDLASENEVREVLKTFYDGRIFEPVATFILSNQPDLAKQVGDAFLKFAMRPKELVIAHTFVGVMVERNHEASTAEKHVKAALDTRNDWPLATDRGAWYASDRGDAQTAVRLWRSIYGPNDPQSAYVAPFTATDNSMNRNEPCWCGSGRKFKQCHFGKPREFSLADRVGWLEAKVSFYIERAGRNATNEMEAMARAYVGKSENLDDDIELALQSQPLIGDAVAHDKGWLQNFITDRGPLLPKDELKLLNEWTQCKRQVLEIVDVQPGESVAVKPLGGGSATTVRERSANTLKKGTFICARIVPDDEGSQFIGGVLTLAKGAEGEIDHAVKSSPEEFLAAVGKIQRS